MITSGRIRLVWVQVGHMVLPGKLEGKISLA
jgi:hypothetical protein